MDNGCVLVFVKVPEKGKVKTRLARDRGPDFALRAYECMALDTLDAVKAAGRPFRICYTPPEGLGRMQAWLGSDHDYLPQTGADLGERMERAFHQAFSEGARQVLLIGSDIPELSVPLLSEAFQALESKDAVIGPARDGGYYLIGFTAQGFDPAVFHGMTWSVGTVLRETLSRLETFGSSTHVLPELGDIDCKADLDALQARKPGPGLAARTLALIREERGVTGSRRL